MAVVTISGNVVRDPQLRFTQSGDAVVSFTVAYTKRKFNRESNSWQDDGDALFLDVTAWKALAEGAAEGLRQGSKVVVTGELRQRNWEKDGQKRSSVELVASDVGVSVRGKKAEQQASAGVDW